VLNVTAIDCSHKDRPSITFTASEVISSRDGNLVLNAKVPTATTVNDSQATSISNLIRDIRQGFDFTLSHDWVIKVYS
jgi:hypothetical protein